MSRTRTPKQAPTAGTPASSLPVAEAHELETYGSDNPLKRAADALTAIASAVAAEPEVAPPVDGEAPPTPAAAGARKLNVEDVKFDFKNNIVPEWAIIPETAADGTPFRFPKGRKVFFLRFRADKTDVPGRGERQLIVWPLSVGDMEFARSRAQGDRLKFADQMTKQCFRAIDGKAVDWTTGGVVNNPEQFWGELGQGYRNLVQTLITQINILDAAETRDFLESCVSLVIATG